MHVAMHCVNASTKTIVYKASAMKYLNTKIKCFQRMYFLQNPDVMYDYIVYNN